MRFLNRPSAYLIPTGILLCSALLQWFPGAVELLSYQQSAIRTGEIWRAITGHWVHLNWMHFALNAAGVALIALLYDEELTWLDWIATLTLMAAFCSAGLMLFDSKLEWYVGLSGVLHGLILAGALLMWREQSVLAMLVCAVVAAKLIQEQWSGGETATAKLIEGNVIVDAHLYGAIAGLLWGALRVVLRRQKSLATTR